MKYIDCEVCDNDGWVDINDEETGGVIGARDCPHLSEVGHPPFDRMSLLDPEAKKNG